jgi:hypothetical protein
MRYGALGPSFRESFRRVFAGVPRLYGFDSVAPTAEYTAPLLGRYFARVGDYVRHLDADGPSGAPNDALLRTFHGTGLVQTSGLMPREPAYADRERVCRIHDEAVPVADRLRMLRDFMDRPDFLDFLPTLQHFVDRHPPDRLDADAARVFDDVRHADAARDEVLDLVRRLDVSALQLELAHLALHLGWMRPAAFRTLAVDGARELLGRFLTSDVVDVVCAIAWHAPIGDAVSADDLRPDLFDEPEGIRLVDCLSPADPRVSDRLAARLDHPDVSTRLWAGYALSHRLPLDDAALARVASHLDDSSAEMRARMRWILTAQPPASRPVRRAVAAHDPTFLAVVGPGRRRR